MIVSFAKKHWWFYALMWLLAIAMLVIDHYDAYTYWYLGFTIAFPISFIGNNGAQWILEGKEFGKYKVADRWGGDEIRNIGTYLK